MANMSRRQSANVTKSNSHFISICIECEFCGVWSVFHVYHVNNLNFSTTLWARAHFKTISVCFFFSFHYHAVIVAACRFHIIIMMALNDFWNVRNGTNKRQTTYRLPFAQRYRLQNKRNHKMNNKSQFSTIFIFHFVSFFSFWNVRNTHHSQHTPYMSVFHLTWMHV